jgi:Fanconi-associated nuclease 1
VLDAVLQDHAHLFLTEEIVLLSQFRTEFSENEQVNSKISTINQNQRLYIRLYQRKGPWFRLNVLEKNYVKEIPDLKVHCTNLSTKGYMIILGENPTDVTQMTMLLDLLTVAELKEIIRLSGLKSSTPKKKGGKIDSTPKQLLLETILQHKSQRTLDGKLLIPKLLAKVLGKVYGIL